MKRVWNGRMFKRVIAVMVMTVFMAGSSISAYAEGEQRGGESVEHVIPADQVDQSRKKVIHEIEIGASGAKTIYSFDWNVPAGEYYMTTCFHLDKDEYVSVAAGVTPNNVTVRVGVQYPDLSEHYIDVTGGDSHSFKADRSGLYNIFVENISNVDIHITVGYVF